MRIERRVDPSCVWDGDRPKRWFVYGRRPDKMPPPIRLGVYELGGRFTPEPGSGLPTSLAPQDETPYGRWHWTRQRLESILAHRKPKEVSQ